MKRMTWLMAGVATMFVAGTSAAGDRLGVLDTLNKVSGNWPEAKLEAEVQGLGAGDEATLGTTIRYGYRASLPGHLHLVHVSSHGEMTVLRGLGGAAVEGRSEPVKVSEPLGAETVYVVLSASPLNELFPGGQSFVSAGDSREAAERLAAQLGAATTRGKVAVARLNYEVVARAGDTQWTTRGIERVLEEGTSEGSGSPAAGGSAPDVRITRGEVAFPTQIGFEFNSDRLTSQGRRDLDVFGEVLVRPQWQSQPIVLEGHTDDIGSDAYNMDLSRRRAESARDYLVRSFGIAAERIRVVAMGESRPAKPNADEAGRAANRRVEFIFQRPAP